MYNVYLITPNNLIIINNIVISNTKHDYVSVGTIVDSYGYR